MGIRLSEEQQNRIRELLLADISQNDIAEEVGVSVRTVKRYKQNMPASVFEREKDTGDNNIKFDYSTSLTKKELALVKKFEKEVALYEDHEEGWIYHLTKSDQRTLTSGLWWMAIAYPESLPEDWLEKLKQTGLEIAISPLHDKDTWDHDSPAMVDKASGEIIAKGDRYKMGDRKKAHYHLLVKCERTMGYREINNLLQSILHCPYIQKCFSLKNAYDYFLHVNAPQKYQGYERDEIVLLNNFHLEPSQYEKKILVDEICRTIVEKGYTNALQLQAHYQGQYEYMSILNQKPFFPQNLLQDNWRKQNPDAAKRITITDNDEKERRCRQLIMDLKNMDLEQRERYFNQVTDAMNLPGIDFFVK